MKSVILVLGNELVRIKQGKTTDKFFESFTYNAFKMTGGLGMYADLGKEQFVSWFSIDSKEKMSRMYDETREITLEKT